MNTAPHEIFADFLRDQFLPARAIHQPVKRLCNVTFRVYGNDLKGVAHYTVIGERVYLEELILDVPAFNGGIASLTIDCGELDDTQYERVERECRAQEGWE